MALFARVLTTLLGAFLGFVFFVACYYAAVVAVIRWIEAKYSPEEISNRSQEVANAISIAWCGLYLVAMAGIFVGARFAQWVVSEKPMAPKSTH
jgi:hypothetical protein